MHDARAEDGRGAARPPRPTLPASAHALIALLTALSACGATPKEKDDWGVAHQLPVSLEALFDNDAIADARDRADGNFDCPDHAADIPGSVFPAEHLPATGSEFSFSGIHFLFPSKERGDFNNLACAGQRITVPEGRYKALHVVGTSENGSFRATLQITYEEGPAEAELALTDWCQKPSFGERPAFEAECRYTYSSATQRVVREAIRTHLWLQKIPLDPAKTLRSLTLPYNRRMHLFAATLEAVDWSDEQKAYATDTAKHYASLSQRREVPADDLGRRLATLTAQLDEHAAEGPLARQFGWLRTQAAYLEHSLGTNRYVLFRPTRQVSRALRTLQADTQALLAGADPFPARRGCFLRSYRSPIDGSLQSYSIAVPNDYKGDAAARGEPSEIARGGQSLTDRPPVGPFPLLVTLHGHGWYRPFQGHPQPVVDGVISVAPHGRGSIDYMLAAERDVLAVIDDVLRDYRIDPDRVLLEGHSMGGTGSWQIGVHHPGRFAALAPVCGNADRRAWDAWKGQRREPPYAIPPRFAALRSHILDSIDPITYAGNLLDLPVLAAHGASDDVVPVGHSRNMNELLTKLGCPIDYKEFGGVRHWGFPNSFYTQRWAWMMAQRRQPAPERVRYKTASLRHEGAYWVRIDRFVEPLAFAEVDARRLGDGGFEITTANVAALTLDLSTLPQAADLREVRATLDGHALTAKPPAPTFVRQDGRWSAAALPEGLAKKAGLEGPVADAFLDGFLLVRGTTSADPWEREVIAREVEARARDWERLFNCRPRVKDDTAVADEDIEHFHLVLYGGPGANAVAARVADKLPIRIESDRIVVGPRAFEGSDVGVKLCYPNPLNPERYVVVLAGLSPDALDQVNNRFGNWFGWGPYDNYEWFDYGVFDSRTLSPETFLAVGFFDPHWKLDAKHEFLGVEAIRAAHPPQRVPRLHRLPEPAPEPLHLSDLAPALIDQHKGCVGYGRSFEGNPLTLGGRKFERGLGVRAPSTIEYQLDGRYRFFRATVGIDLEDLIEPAAARRRGEYVQFLVFGDGKRLYSSEWLQWDSRPVDVEVEIRGVKALRLEVDCSASRWLVGSADWADARVSTR